MTDHEIHKCNCNCANPMLIPPIGWGIMEARGEFHRPNCPTKPLPEGGGCRVRYRDVKTGEIVLLFAHIEYFLGNRAVVVAFDMGNHKGDKWEPIYVPDIFYDIYRNLNKLADEIGNQ